MAGSLKSFTTRRWVAAGMTLVASLIAIAVVTAYSLSLHDAAFGSGWALLALMLFLALYNLRKKLTYPPLGRAAAWLQLHVYFGVFSVVLFLLHIDMRMPNGLLECTLAALFVAVAGSGMLGILLSRIIPARLADRGQEVLFERIPQYRRQFREEAEKLVIDCVEHDDGTTLANFYRDRLAHFFYGSRNFGHHLMQSSRPCGQLQKELQSLDRYLSDEERTRAVTLAQLIEAKDDLDYHHAMQWVLKHWLFFHVPLTYAMLLFIVIHMTLVLAFRAGVP